MSDIKLYRTEDLSLNEILPGARMFAIGLDKSMLTYFEIAPNADFPEHKHEAEQITMVIEGEIVFEYEGKTVTLRPGEVIAIPSNVPHRAFTGDKPCNAVDAWSPVRKEYLAFQPKPLIRPASQNDMPFIRGCILRFRLDDEDMDCLQFIVAEEGGEVVGFGRIRPHREVFELGCVGVVEGRRNQGIGRMIVEHLMKIFPSSEVYITTDMPEYFARFGFERVEPGPHELVEKLARVCKSKCREGAMVMVYKIPS